MCQSIQLVIFTLDEQYYALHLAAVERVVWAVQVTLLPRAPAIVLGVIKVQSQIVPVFNLRQRLRLPARDIALSDQFIIADMSGQPVALAADAVIGVVEVAEQKTRTREKMFAGLAQLAGVATFGDQLVLIHDLDTFLSLNEQETLNNALRADD
jgi:purine-binding chemotaxis protein CheW